MLAKTVRLCAVCVQFNSALSHELITILNQLPSATNRSNHFLFVYIIFVRH